MDANIADTCYISIACNSFPHCLDWGNNNLICYGACNGVAIYDPKVYNYVMYCLFSMSDTNMSNIRHLLNCHFSMEVVVECASV